MVDTRQEDRDLLMLTTSPGWQTLKALAERLVYRQTTYLSGDNFKDLLTVGRCQGQIKALADLVSQVENAAKRASKAAKED